MLVCAVGVQAQIMNVSNIERLTVTGDENRISQAVAISPQGDYILLSTDTKNGLVKLDLASGGTKVLTDKPGTGSDVQISSDGQQVVYGEMSYKNKRRYEAVKTINLASGKSKTAARRP